MRWPICLAAVCDTARWLAKSRLVRGGEELYWSKLRHRDATDLLLFKGCTMTGPSLIDGVLAHLPHTRIASQETGEGTKKDLPMDKKTATLIAGLTMY